MSDSRGQRLQYSPVRQNGENCKKGLMMTPYSSQRQGFYHHRQGTLEGSLREGSRARAPEDSHSWSKLETQG